MFKYEKKIIEFFEKLDRLQEQDDGYDYFLMQVGAQELLSATGYEVDVTPDGYFLKKLSFDKI